MKHLFTFLLIIVPFVHFGQNTVIKGQLKNAPFPYLLLSKHEDNEVMYFTDTIPLDENGNWNLKWKTKEISYFSFYTGTDLFELVLLPGESISMHADNRFFDQSYFLVGKGAQRNTCLHRCWLKENENISSLFGKLFVSDSLTTITEYKNRTTDFLKMRQSFMEEFPELKVAIGDEETVRKMMDVRITEFRSQFAFSQEVSAIQGTSLPNYTGQSLKGDPVELASFKGKITVVDFWASWCTICFENFAELQKLEQEFGDRVNFVSIGTYCKQEEWKMLTEKVGLKHQFFFDNKWNEGLSIGLYYLPRYIILDENHKVLQCSAPLPNSGLLREYLLSYLKE